MQNVSRLEVSGICTTSWSSFVFCSMECLVTLNRTKAVEERHILDIKIGVPGNLTHCSVIKHQLALEAEVHCWDRRKSFMNMRRKGIDIRLSAVQIIPTRNFKQRGDLMSDLTLTADSRGEKWIRPEAHYLQPFQQQQFCW